MNPQDAKRITMTLMRGFPRDELKNDQAELFATEIALLADAQVAQQATVTILRNSDRFPTIHEFRAAYRTINEARRSNAHLGITEGRSPMPEWVHVWAWMRDNGDKRYLPQQLPELTPGETAISHDEYDQLHAAWVGAGLPKASLGSQEPLSRLLSI